jgi:hypothetical protein
MTATFTFSISGRRRSSDYPFRIADLTIPFICWPVMGGILGRACLACTLPVNGRKAWSRMDAGASVPRKGTGEMRGGPSTSACRSRRQTTLSCNGKEPLW